MPEESAVLHSLAGPSFAEASRSRVGTSQDEIKTSDQSKDSWHHQCGLHERENVSRKVPVRPEIPDLRSSTCLNRNGNCDSICAARSGC